MRIGNIRMRVTLATAAVVTLTAQLWGQTGGSPAPAQDRNPFAGDPKAVTAGAVLFRQECVFCHGVAARGGMRGPDLTTGTWSHGGADPDLVTTISTGVPGTAMPPNNLKTDEIWQIVTYLRSVQQPMAAPIGDPARGEELFFGATRCSSCHVVNGRGGRLGPELSTVGSARSRAYLVDSIREPSKQLTRNGVFGDSVTLKYDTVTAVTADGRTIVGVPMNEDTFTVQMMDAAERVHSLDKKTLKSFRHDDRSLMPAYDAGRFPATDLNDVVAYLQSLRAPTPAKKGGTR